MVVGSFRYSCFSWFLTWLVKLGTHGSTSFLLGLFATRCIRKSHHFIIRLRPPILHHRAMHLAYMLLGGIAEKNSLLSDQSIHYITPAVGAHIGCGVIGVAVFKLKYGT